MDPSTEAAAVPDEGVVFAQALARKDPEALRAVLAPDVDFRGLTPRRFWECGTPEEVVDVVFGNWFEPQEEILALLDVATGEPVEDTRRVGYRLALRTPDGLFTVEQQAYYRTEGGRIAYLRVLCSGYRPAAEPAPAG
ncbi:MAG TPA: hypothetical protein VFL46_02160 [Phycicoccus sp.]|nr:hypothetical protein [Phycicoccus sp.]